MRAILPVLVLVSVVVGTPMVSAQAATPVAGCTRDCDPLEANDGRIKGPSDPLDLFLYAHLDDIMRGGVLNTQLPTPEESLPEGLPGFLLPSVETKTGICVDGTPTCTDVRLNGNGVTFELTNWLVHRNASGLQYGPGNGVGYDLELRGESPRLFWYMSAQHGLTENREANAGALPALDIRARLESGFKGGDFLAESVSKSTVSRTTMISLPGQPAVYEFEIPLSVRAGSFLPSSRTIRLEVEWSQLTLGNLADAGSRDWRVHVGPEYRPRLVLPVYEPARAVNESLSHYDGQYYVRWEFESALGAYDFDESTLRLESVEAPSGAKFQFDHVGLRRSLNCFAESDPIKSIWVLDYRNATLPDGAYRMRASILNLQGTYRTASDFEFKVVDGVPDGLPAFEGSAKVPGLGVPTLFVLVGLVACVAARRRAA